MNNVHPLTAVELFEKLKNIKIGGTTCKYPLEKCEKLVPLVNAINQLKVEKNAVILAHSYVSPEIIYGVADYVGDSYKLAKDALASQAETIVFAAVRFMAETAKILNPDKKVFLPATLGGCTLADAIDAAKMHALKNKYPHHAFITYINTTAEVKALSDVIVTSSNVYDIVERYPNDKIVFLPDKLMGENVIKEMERRHVHKDIVLFDGTCYVHEDYDSETIDYLKHQYGSDLQIVVHPECSPAITKKADFVGSTSQMMHFVKTDNHHKYFVLTECGLVDRLQNEITPGTKQFIGSCTMCQFMKSNELEHIYRVLAAPRKEDEVFVASEVITAARQSLDNMFVYADASSVKNDPKLKTITPHA
ncbi:quinolinate synthase A [Spirochaetota bacterium]|nr:quinolinate synthase A [Spirochaetota bacterium]